VSDAKNTKRTCGGPSPPKVSQQGKSVSHCTATRKVLFQSTFPKVIRSDRVEINYGTSINSASLDPDQYNCMPPLSQIDQILQKVNEGEAEIVLDYGCYSVETIRLFKKFHADKVIQDQVRNEIYWVKQGNYLTVDAVSHLDENYVQSLLEIVQNHAQNDVVSIAGYRYYIDDLTYLFSERWLSNSLIYQICLMLNTKFTESKTLVYCASDVMSQAGFCQKMYNDFANIKEGQLILIIPVGCYNGTYFMDSMQITHEDGSKSTVNCNHFALAVYSLELDMVIYADSLGWGIPDSVKTIFRNVAQKMGKPCPVYNMCHQSGSNVNNATHKCTNLCAPNYPLQTCTSICGVSVIVGATLACLYRKGFYGLAGINSHLSSGNIGYLRNISLYSKFLRRVIMHWIVAGTINVNMLVVNLPSSNRQECKSALNADSPHTGGDENYMQRCESMGNFIFAFTHIYTYMCIIYM